jgi:hypothetical protein
VEAVENFNYELNGLGKSVDGKLVMGMLKLLGINNLTIRDAWKNGASGIGENWL